VGSQTQDYTVLEVIRDITVIFGLFLLPIPVIIGFWRLGERWWQRGGWLTLAGGTSYLIALGVSVLYALFLLPYAFGGGEGFGPADRTIAG
jgi:hypothetical protein